MDETVLFPSPNWFQQSGLTVTEDDWILYGGPSKSLCVLEPLTSVSRRLASESEGHRAHVIRSAHPEKIVCIDVCPEWPSNKSLLTGSVDGTVKQWSLEHVNNGLLIKSTHSHDVHRTDKEEVLGVGYFNNGYAVTVGAYSNIAKWDLNSNVLKTYKNVVKNFKPVCVAFSPHIHLNVAIGTKQGVVFVLDVNGAARIVYKVRGQDDEIMRVGWCPQYEVTVKKVFEESKKTNGANKRMEKIRNEPEASEVLEELEERMKNSASVPHFTEDESCILLPGSSKESTKVSTPKPKDDFNESGIGKTLPEDSFDDLSVQEDDMFDIYKDHEADEFGHKKYEPQDIVVKIKQEKEEIDYLDECRKLKEEILKKKNEPEPSIEALVDALDNTHVDGTTEQENGSNGALDAKKEPKEAGVQNHYHKHLLASIGKQGTVRIWSKTGKLVASCNIMGIGGNHQKNQKQQRVIGTTTLLWYKPDQLLMADGKAQLLECNPLRIDSKNKLIWQVVHTQHKRGLYSIKSGVPRVYSTADQSGDQSDWPVWTVAQDRNLIRYSVQQKKVTASYNTCGGFIYFVAPCPYDAKRVAACVGDGAVRVVDMEPLEHEDTTLSAAKVTSFWNNVQGKVLSAAWHPTKEYKLAFGTAESRVGVLDTSNPDRPAKLLLPALNFGVYSLSWANDNYLYACGGGKLALYNTGKPEEDPTTIEVVLDGMRGEVSAVLHHERGLVIGTPGGAVAVLAHRAESVLATVHVFSKMIHTIAWHPQETSSSTEVSPYKDLIAVCSRDKCNSIVILEYSDKDDKQLSVWKTLVGHKATVYHLQWNPHVDGQIVSTSQDGTVRVWDVSSGSCTSIFGGHTQTALCAAWSPQPQCAGHVLSGGADCCLRMWDVATHPADTFQVVKHETNAKREKKRPKEDKPKVEEDGDEEENKAAILENKIRTSKRFLLPMCYKQMTACGVNAPRRMLQLYLQNAGDSSKVDKAEEINDCGLDFLKLFGSTNDINDLMATEMERQLDTGNLESWFMLNIFRGHIDAMIQFASQKDLLDTFLLSITPCVSVKYWKDATQLYLAQIDRFVAKGEENKLSEMKYYGGPVYRRAAHLLSMQDITGAVALLAEARFYKEAYLLCRTRYIDSLAKETLQSWADNCTAVGQTNLAAVAYIALGNLAQAAAVLGRSNDEGCLSLAADLAKNVGQTTFADHIEKKREQIINNKDQEQAQDEVAQDEVVDELPTRGELLANSGPMCNEKGQSLENSVLESKENSCGIENGDDTEKILEELPSRVEQL